MKNKQVSKVCHKHSDCCDRKVVVGGEGPVVVGLCCSEPTSLGSAWAYKPALKIIFNVLVLQEGLNLGHFT